MQLQAEDNENEKKGKDSKENRLITSTESFAPSTVQKSNSNTNNFVYILIDHVFDVKGVGTVILGCIKHGEIKTYDELEINPINKNIVIKSIQMHDDPVSYSKKPARVGLAIKGVTAKDISRGDIITSPGISKTISNSFQIKFNKNPYFRGEIIETQNYMINIGLQIRSVKIKKIDDSELYVTLEKSIAYIENDLCIVFSPDSKTMRIIGHGVMK
jgi:selenocysteine-specific translation elongation factor